MSPESFADCVAELASKWNEAEGLLKKGEQVNRNVVIPSINELRYAGRGVVNAHAAYLKGDAAAVERHIAQADGDLKRAKRDIIDAVFGFVSQDAKTLRDQVGVAAAAANFPKYGELFGLIKKVEKSMGLSRSRQESENEFYAEMAKEDSPLWHLCDLREEFSASVPAIEEIIKQRKMEIQRQLQESKKRERIGLFFAILSLLVALMTLVTRFF